jgi:hypothetical protein
VASIACCASRNNSPHGKKLALYSDPDRYFMGLIVLAMGVQFALTGVRAFMAIQ